MIQEARKTEEGLTVFAEGWRSSRWRWLGEGRSELLAIPRRSRWRRQAVLFDVGDGAAGHAEASGAYG